MLLLLSLVSQSLVIPFAKLVIVVNKFKDLRITFFKIGILYPVMIMVFIEINRKKYILKSAVIKPKLYF